eukprot:Selendium_serpulae@DN6499_c3_g1_i8.p1
MKHSVAFLVAQLALTALAVFAAGQADLHLTTGSTGDVPLDVTAPPVDGGGGVMNGVIDGTAACHLYNAGVAGSCGYAPTEDDLTSTCGTPEDPCASGLENTESGSPNCGKCFHMTLTEPGSTDAGTCNGECPPYEEQLYVKIMDTSTPTFSVAQNGWDVLCPYVCAGDVDVCVKDKAQCVYTLLDNCSGGVTKNVTYQEVACGEYVPTAGSATGRVASMGGVIGLVMALWTA